MVIAALVGASGQILFKKSAPYFTLNIMSYVNNPQTLIKMIPFGVALVAYAGAVVLSIIAYKHGDVSKLFPIASVTYIFTIILAGIFLGEQITFMKILGGLVIIGGVALINI